MHYYKTAIARLEYQDKHMRGAKDDLNLRLKELKRKDLYLTIKLFTLNYYLIYFILVVIIFQLAKKYRIWK